MNIHTFTTLCAIYTLPLALTICIYIYTYSSHDCTCLFALYIYIYTRTSTCSVVLTCILPTNSYQDTLDFSINMFCVWMQRNLFRHPLSQYSKIMYYTYIYIIMCMWLSNFMPVFFAELGPERPSSWDPTRMGKHEAALTHSAPLRASVLDTCQNGRRGFDLHIVRRLLFKLIWKAAFVWVTPYLVQLTFSLEACSWKNGDLVFQRWSFFSILETCMGIDDPYVKKPRWRRNWNSISKMIKDGLAEGMVTRNLVSDLVFFRASWIETCQLD